MKSFSLLVSLAALVAATPALAQSGVARLYVIECGERTAPDVAPSGDAVHLADNWSAKRVPAMNVDKDKSVATMQRMAALMEQDKAQLWINQDKPQAATMKRPPEFYQ